MSIQSIMLVALGFLVASLLALLIAPAFWSRAVRLTTRRIKETLPITDAEVRADKDKLRAEFALTVHRLETKIEQAELKRARHLIDINRREATISQLEQELSATRAAIEEHENARRVLEHTVGDRLPKLDTRLSEARELLHQRDAEIAALAQSTDAHLTALNEATAINAQQAAEIERLTTALTVRGARNKNVLQDPAFDGEVALRSEIEALRAKTREQAAIIARLQQTASNKSDAPASGARAQPSLELVTAASIDETRLKLERELRDARARFEQQTAELESLRAERDALKTAENAAGDESKVALRARLAGLQTQSDQQTDQLRRLRTELAAANERLAQQSQHFMEQLRRLGAGTMPAAPQGRLSEAPPAPPRLSLAERVSQTREQAKDQVAAAAAAANDDPTTTPDTTAPAANETGGKGRLIDRISSLNKA